MTKIKLIYNPVSGAGEIKNNLDSIIENFQRRGYQVIPYKLLGKNDVKTSFLDPEISKYDAIIAAGGDGTIHDVVNQMISNNIAIPLGIIPSGTSNDFASFLGLPKTISKCIDVITISKNIKTIDVGKINNKYFINVVAGGMFSGIAHKTNRSSKNSMGMLAYYFKAIEELSNFKAFNAQIVIDDKVINEKILLFLVLNSSNAGGLKIAPQAQINDGKFDICIIRNCTIADFGALFLKLLKGEHINDDRCLMFQTNNINISANKRVQTDIDGEEGHELPIRIEVIQGGLKVFTGANT